MQPPYELSAATASTQAAPQATIVIVTYNSRAYFARLAEALSAQTAPFRLIVWDNASESAQRPTSQDFPVADLHQSQTNLGFAVGNNAAAAKVDTPFLALLNPDAFPEPEWLAELIAAAQSHPDAAALGSVQILASDPTLLDGAGDCYAPYGAAWRGGHGAPRSSLEAHLDARKDSEVFSACAAAALYRVEAWRQAGGLDESYFCYLEDVDLCFRLRLLGWRVVLAPRAIVHHIAGGSKSSAEFQALHQERNAIWTFFKNMPSVPFWLMLGAFAVLLASHACTSVLRGHRQATWRGIGAGLAGLPRIWRARASSFRPRGSSQQRTSWPPCRGLQSRCGGARSICALCGLRRVKR